MHNNKTDIIKQESKTGEEKYGINTCKNISKNISK